MPEGICDGLTVVEAGGGSMAVSLAGMILADNGARVLKVEAPEGDPLRGSAPNGFLLWNRGKESVVADLRTPEGQAAFRALAAAADVVLEGFGTNVLEGWGLGYDDLKASNPGLVLGSVKGFASKGPYANLKAYEGIVLAKSGWFNRGMFAFRPGPIYVNSPLASHGAAEMLVAGVVAAVGVRERTGTGQRVEASLWQGLNPFDYFGTTTWQVAQRQGSGQPSGPPSAAGVVASRYNMMPCTSDGRWFVVCTMLPHQAQALLRGCGLGHLLDDPRFAQAPYFEAVDDAVEYERHIWEAFRAHTAEQITERFLAERDIAFEMARTTEEAMTHPQVIHNGHVVTVDDPAHGTVEEVGPVAMFASSPSVISRSAPALDAHAALPTTPPPAPARRDPTPAHPLAGKTIVEFGYFYAMPYGVTMAAALGARVIKLEDSKGDPQRWSFGVRETGGNKAAEGKESLSIDLKQPEAQEIVRRIVADADMFVCGFRSGVAEKMGLGYDDLKAINPRLVWLHAAGYGSDGPYAHRPMYAQTASALAGGFHRYAGYWLRPENAEGMSVDELQLILGPRIQSLAEGDANASLALFSSIVLALRQQDRTGEGQFVRTTMINGNVYSLADDFTRYEGKPVVPLADPDLMGLHARYRLYETAEGWVFLAAPKESEWAGLTTALDHPELADDVRFATEDARRANDDALIAELGAIFATRPAAAWEADLTGKGIGCVECYEGSASQFTSTDPGLRESGLTYEVDDPTFGSLVRYGLPAILSETPGRVEPAVLNGQHTDAILTELGFDAAGIADLRARQIVFSDRP